MFSTLFIIASVSLIYLALSLRYVSKVKHPRMSVGKAYARVFLILCGTPFVVFLTSYVTAMLVFGMGDAEILGSVGRAVINGVALFPVLPAIYLVRRMIRTPPRGFQGAISDRALA